MSRPELGGGACLAAEHSRLTLSSDVTGPGAVGTAKRPGRQLIIEANIVTTSKAPVTTSDALVMKSKSNIKS